MEFMFTIRLNAVPISVGKEQVAIFWYVKYLKLKYLRVIKVHGCGV